MGADDPDPDWKRKARGNQRPMRERRKRPPPGDPPPPEVLLAAIERPRWSGRRAARQGYAGRHSAWTDRARVALAVSAAMVTRRGATTEAAVRGATDRDLASLRLPEAAWAALVRWIAARERMRAGLEIVEPAASWASPSGLKRDPAELASCKGSPWVTMAVDRMLADAGAACRMVDVAQGPRWPDAMTREASDAERALLLEDRTRP